MPTKRPKKRASVERPYNNGTMSAAEFKSFIISALRKASTYWKPKNIAIGRARKSRGVYVCESCGKEGPASLPPLPGKKRKRKNIQADHFREAVPVTGWTSYDDFIARLFVEAEQYQAICRECHSSSEGKTQTENRERRAVKNGEEIWRAIDEFPEKEYYVSNLGRVKGPKKILNILDNGNGYKQATIGHGTKRYIHRLVAQAFLGEVNGLQVCHKDDDPSNNNANNLFIGTAQDNMDDKVNKGRHILGGKTIYQYSLQKEFIKKWIGGGGEIMRELGYNDSNIYNCCNGKYKQSKGFIWSREEL